MKIKVLQWMYGDEEYLRLSQMINESYCRRHGYEYVCVRKEPTQGKHYHWECIQQIYDNLIDCDYLLYLDGDAAVFGQDIPVESFLPDLADGSILCAADCGDEQHRWNPDLPNAGQMLLVCNDYTRKIVRHWLDQADKMGNQHPVTQRALWNKVMPVYPYGVKVLRNYYRMAAIDGWYIRHFYVMSAADRNRLMRKMAEELNLLSADSLRQDSEEAPADGTEQRKKKNRKSNG